MMIVIMMTMMATAQVVQAEVHGSAAQAAGRPVPPGCAARGGCAALPDGPRPSARRQRLPLDGR